MSHSHRSGYVISLLVKSHDLTLLTIAKNLDHNFERTFNPLLTALK